MRGRGWAGERGQHDPEPDEQVAVFLTYAAERGLTWAVLELEPDGPTGPDLPPKY